MEKDVEIMFGCGGDVVFIKGFGFYQKVDMKPNGDYVIVPKLHELNNIVKNGGFENRKVDLDSQYYAEHIIEDWDKSHWEIKEKAVKE